MADLPCGQGYIPGNFFKVCDAKAGTRSRGLHFGLALASELPPALQADGVDDEEGGEDGGDDGGSDDLDLNLGPQVVVVDVRLNNLSLAAAGQSRRRRRRRRISSRRCRIRAGLEDESASVSSATCW